MATAPAAKQAGSPAHSSYSPAYKGAVERSAGDAQQAAILDEQQHYTREQVAKAVVEGKLGPAAKVSPKNPGGGDQTHVICVYTNDFTDVAEVTRVREELRKLGFKIKLHYKPDVYTELNVMLSTIKDMGLKRATLYTA
ncbi:hypothetical protein WJX72_004441 [[Myrmecia] bisecta]|uniref:Uncharacterized protein n=1 Tax=[Myrmecia] bisecta TaxID=41462 RepID=A0AAW1P1Y2_9CHLO